MAANDEVDIASNIPSSITDVFVHDAVDFENDKNHETEHLLHQQEQRGLLGRRAGWWRTPYWYLLDAVLVILVTILFVQYAHLRIQVSEMAKTNTHLDLQGDITGYVPGVSNRIVVFNMRPEFMSNHSSEASLVEAREHWKTLVPPGQGFLDITDEVSKKYDFPKLISYHLPAKFSTTGHDRHGMSLGTSVVHSLHCLYTIMAEYDLAYQGNKPLSLGHMDHCFEYIRQVIMCGGDLALAGETFPGGSSQFGVAHVCKNWDEIYDFLDKNRVSTEWQFGDAPTHFVPPT